ncbi:CRISPR-associated protein Cas1 [Thermoanaerobacter mathranii subsp. mathranii str. A3]|jgi:CRISPR-associated protein Cas1|uniref:CRISPR-associated endonuclease Cas1 n=1 Tax=Thermoanaerobacter mathranii subsp. mathranii (strain DSM 11426 / CCUG 53645 / CIP 108742 / A3) TaxID=583358 RepID=A0ABN3Z012_THEM3|nr:MULTISPECIES: type I-B CRISPR-associated endonuclease Cas1b [Thermoanaerobacter]ADH59809.1 CRISPR-associated protein Cas1 [Thermoanaerobacter mathranii subsp. mathranii str. A3]
MQKSLYLTSNGRLRRHENTLYFETEVEKRSIDIENVEQIHIFGEVDLNTKALNYISQYGIVLHFYNYYGFYAGSFLPRKKNVSGDVVVRQALHYLDREKRLFLAYCFVESAVYHMMRNLRERKEAEAFLIAIEDEWEKGRFNISSIAELMGLEGRIRNIYYQSFNWFLPEDFVMEKREKRPPTNPINALISFGNSLIYSHTLSQIYQTQLDPTISFLHEPSEKRFSLSLDISEIFKPLIVDTVIFKLLNNSKLTLEHFDEDLNYCYLNHEGRKIFLKELQNKLETTVRHRQLNRNVSYKSFIRLECYKLIKHFIGDQVYSPLKAWW